MKLEMPRGGRNQDHEFCLHFVFKKIDDFPKNWNSFPHLMDTQKIGDGFGVERKNLVLKVC